MTSRPDIVLLVLDTQRVDRLSCYGYAAETSPYIDELAADSTLFQCAVAPAQWTIPSHASMFTGVYPSTHNTIQSFSVLPETLPTLAERLRDGGYFTAAFCNNPLVGVVNNGLRRGFLSFLNYSGLLTSRPNQAGVNRNLYDRYRQVFKGFLADTISSMQDVFARSDYLLNLSFSPLMVPLWQTALSFKENTGKSLNDAARLLIERKDVAEDQPIFSFINLMGVHMPYHPSQKNMERFAPHLLHNQKAQRYLRHFNSDVFGWYAPLSSTQDELDKATLDGMYNAEVATQDELVGAFLKKLRESGLLDNTLLIVCADHGEHLGEKRLVGHSLSLYNELVRVPLIIRDPSNDLPRGTTVEHFVSTRRIFQTALTAARLADGTEEVLTLAQSSASDLDGGTVFSEGVPPRNVVKMLHQRRPQETEELGWDQTRRAVWSKTHKLIQTGEHRLELYSVLDDPNENLNLHDILPERVEALQKYLHTFV
ncbi:MAG: sulfatase, partial [Chloroflexota bacterium]|nr:sulfatase [Chloroflexota bacterium]